MKTIGKTTNWDAKKAFSEFTFYEFFPTIYIDDYWDYYINLFDLKSKWETFLEEFTQSGFTYKSFYEEYNRICENGSKLLLNCSLEEAKTKIIHAVAVVQNINVNIEPILTINEGKYINVDIHSAIDVCLKYIGIFNNNFKSTYDIIKSLTPYKIFHNLKRLRVSIYYYTFDSCSTIYLNLFKIINTTLMNKIINSSNPEMKLLNEQSKLIHRTKGDSFSYEYNENVKNITGKDYICDGISYNISLMEIKIVPVLGRDLKCFRYVQNGYDDIKVFYADRGYACPELWPIAIKKAFNDLGELNEKDLTIGYEDQIFFQFDKSEV